MCFLSPRTRSKRGTSSKGFLAFVFSSASGLGGVGVPSATPSAFLPFAGTIRSLNTSTTSVYQVPGIIIALFGRKYKDSFNFHIYTQTSLHFRTKEV